MEQFKEMTIKTPQPYRMPTLELNGKYLEDFGFTPETLVSVTYQDACLTLRTGLTDLSVNDAPHASHVIMVRSKRVRLRPRTQLILDGFLLKRYGFDVGDRIVLHIKPNIIQITRITHFTTDLSA